MIYNKLVVMHILLKIEKPHNQVNNKSKLVTSNSIAGSDCITTRLDGHPVVVGPWNHILLDLVT